MFAGEDSVPGKVFIGSALLEKKTPVNATNSLLKVQPSSKKKLPLTPSTFCKIKTLSDLS